MTVILRVEPFKDRFGNMVEFEDFEAFVTAQPFYDGVTISWCLFNKHGNSIDFESFNPEEDLQKWWNEGRTNIDDKVNRKTTKFLMESVKPDESKFLSISARSFVICIDCGHVVHNKMKGGHRCNV